MRGEVLRCDDALAAVLDDGAVSLAARAHVRGCAECGRAVARHRALRADLRRLGSRPAPGERAFAGELLVTSILAGLDHCDRTARRVRVLGACAVVGAVAGGVAAGAVAMARGRRLALAV